MMLSISKWHYSRLAKFWMIAATIIFFGCFLLQVDFDRIRAAQSLFNDQVNKPYGTLTPGNEVYSGFESCTDKEKDGAIYALHFGRTTIRFPTLPHTVMLVHNKEVLGASKSADGDLAINLNVFDQSGNILVSVKNNNYTVSSSVFKKEQKDFHGFEIFDQRNNLVLSITLINRYEAYITGSLVYVPGMIVTDDKLYVPRLGTFVDSCMSNISISDYSIE